MNDIITYTSGEFIISTDAAKLDIEMIHRFLSVEAYWSKGIPYSLVKQSVSHSLIFGLFHKDEQVGFARIISDYTTIAYLADVFILPAYRGRGLSKWLLQCIHDYPMLQNLRRWILLTRDAHELYRQFGWTAIADPEKWMEQYNKEVYIKK